MFVGQLIKNNAAAEIYGEIKFDFFNILRSNSFTKTLRNLWRNDHFVKLNSRCDSSQGEGGARNE